MIYSKNIETYNIQNKKKYQKGITAFLPVYNEEKRIYGCLSSMQWCNEVIIIDKNSTDSTIEIASNFPNTKILFLSNTPDYNPKEFDIFLKECQTEWCITITASDLIHPELAKEIVNLINLENFNYDTISIPYRPYMLGIYHKSSPWYATSINKIVKVNSVNLNFRSVHAVFNPSYSSIYNIKLKNPVAVFYHLTHENADALLERYSRYWRGEPNNNISLSNDLFYILKKAFQLLFLKFSFFKGKSLIALSFSFLSYYMMSYVFKWEKLYGNAEIEYANIRVKILELWKKNI